MTESDHISITRNGHSACAVSRDLSQGQNDPHFWNPWPNFSHFVTFRALRRRIRHVIGENSCYPIVKATKFAAHAQYHVTSA